METLLRRSLSKRTIAPPPAQSSGAATAIILCGDDLKILFIHRANQPADPWANQMALPGGRRDPEDESLESTAIRETMEEVGLDLSGAESWGPLASIQARSRKGLSELWVTPYVYRIPGPPPALRLNPNEAQDAVWIPVGALLQPEAKSIYRLHRDNARLDLPAWVFETYTIWGLTYFMVTDLLQPLLLRHEIEPSRP